MATTAFPVNPKLTAIAMVYSNPATALIADEVMPRVPTAKKFVWSNYDVAQGYTVPQTLVGRKSTPTEVDFTGTLVNDEVLDYGLDDVVPNDEISAWESMLKPERGGPPNPLDISAMLTTKLIQLDREVRVAGRVFNTVNYAAGNQATLSGTSQWSDFANSNPLDAILAALDIPVYRPNVAVFGQATFTKLRQHPKIVQAVFGSAQTGGVVTRDQLAQVLEIARVVVGAGFVNTAKKGQAVNNQRVWGKHASFLYVDAEAAMAQQPCWGFTAQWGDKVAGDIPEPKMGIRGSQRVRVAESVKEVTSAPALGYYFQNAVA
jgi:hypothetical protein